MDLFQCEIETNLCVSILKKARDGEERKEKPCSTENRVCRGV